MPEQVVNANKARLFDGLIIPGTELVAIHRVFVGLRLFTPELQDKAWFLSKMTASVPGQIAGKTVWWRVLQEDGKFTYINTDPGEYRTEEPLGEVLTLDVPDVPPQSECRDLIAAALRQSRNALIADPFHHDLASVAQQFLNSPDAVLKDGRERVRAIVPLMRNAESHIVAGPLGKMVYECLTCGRLDRASFAAIMLLLQLQRMVSEWIEQDWISNPVGMLGAFLELVGRGAKRERLRSVCEEIAAVEYAEGRRLLTAALNASSLFSMGRLLADAHHCFQLVHHLDFKARACGLEFRRPRPEIVLEESFVCANTGLAYGAVMMSQHPETIAKEILKDSENSRWRNVESAEQRFSSHVHPFVNRYFVQIWSAQAMTLAEDPGTVKRGLDKLLALRHDMSVTGASDNIDFECGWIDQALLGAYRSLGMATEVQRIATSIAGRLIVSKMLGSHNQV